MYIEPWIGELDGAEGIRCDLVHGGIEHAADLCLVAAPDFCDLTLCHAVDEDELEDDHLLGRAVIEGSEEGGAHDGDEGIIGEVGG